MISKELIDRINALARKARSEGLTAGEKAEQARLRAEYLQGFRENFRAVLAAIEFTDPDKER